MELQLGFSKRSDEDEFKGVSNTDEETHSWRRVEEGGERVLEFPQTDKHTAFCASSAAGMVLISYHASQTASGPPSS